MKKLPSKNSSQGAVLHEGEADLAPPSLTLLLTKQALRRAVPQASQPIENKESIRNMSIVWVTLWLVGLSLVVSVATLLIALRALEKVNRSERAGDEQLAILREEQEHLKLKDEGLPGSGGRAVDLLLEELERRRSENGGWPKGEARAGR